MMQYIRVYIGIIMIAIAAFWLLNQPFTQGTAVNGYTQQDMIYNLWLMVGPTILGFIGIIVSGVHKELLDDN